jgi:NTE family protein
MKKVRLILGSGGARGMAHIGVIEELEKEGFEIIEVVGCSMGAVVGGIYCAGYLQDYKYWLMKLSRLDVFMLLDFTLSSQGFVKGEKVFRAMEDFIGDDHIENFKIPFTAVATDLLSKKEIHYKSGSLFKALRASIAIPTILTPVVQGRAQLVDGGVLNPLPVNLVTKQAEEIIVAVNLNADIPYGINAQPPVENQEKAAYQKMLDAFRSQIWRMDSKAEENIERLSLFDILNKSYDLTQDRLTELMVKVHISNIGMIVPLRDLFTIFAHHSSKFPQNLTFCVAAQGGFEPRGV